MASRLRKKSRRFLVSQEEVFEMLDASESDDDETNFLDEEDTEFLDGDEPEEAGVQVEVEIEGAEAEAQEAAPPRALKRDFKWSKTSYPVNRENCSLRGEVKLDLFDDDCPTELDVFLKVSQFEKLIESIVLPQSLLYMQQKGNVFETNKDELMAFFGLVYVMSYHVVPSLKDYWSQEPTLRVQAVADVMPRDRFLEIRKALHFADNESYHDPTDRAWKITPVIKHFNDSFMAAMDFSEQMAVDEHMVKFKGQNRMKQYMPKKPCKRGFKLWCLNDSNTGYLYKCTLYTGAKQDREEGLGESVVLSLAEPLYGSHCQLFFDNFFTSPGLIHELKKEGIYSCGTVRGNRKGMPQNLKIDKAMKRGDIDRRYCDGVHLVKWMDTRAVLLLSTIESAMPTVIKKRRQKGSRERVDVRCPKIVETYNQGMNGTDLMDQLKVCYENDRRYPGKFYLRLFFDLLDIAVVNSFIVFSKITEGQPNNSAAKTLLKFKVAVAKGLVSNYCSRVRTQRRIPRIGTDEEHVPTRLDYNERGRCKLCTKRKIDSRTVFFCEPCGVNLCHTTTKHCFVDWHRGIRN